MSQSLGQHDFDLLLEELEQRVLAHPKLAQEYEQAHEEFLAGSTSDVATKLRFREWFLIERVSASLGTSPVVAWAPDDVQSEDIWQRLLESFFGIFHEVTADDHSRPVLEDLWSGRQLRLDRPLPAHDDNLVVAGRCAQGSEESHVLLPGVIFLASDGLRDALASDLSRIRAEQPRSRLSQRQCEHLLLPFRQQSAPELQADEALEALEMSLAGEACWTADRLLETAAEHGATEALNMLAFDTEADLEPVRAALATLNAVGARDALERKSSPTTASTVATVSPGEIESALAAFELARKEGTDLAASFEVLENTLELPVGDSEPFAELTQDSESNAESMGPDDVPGMSMWLATFLWEKEAVGIATTEAEAREISAFLEHLQAVHGIHLDPGEVGAGDLLGYLLRSQDIEILDVRLQGLHTFVTWLVEEQGSALAETLHALQQSTGALLRDVVILNNCLEQQGAAKDSVAWLKSVDPLKVGAEDGEEVAVVGIPEDCNFTPTVGDCFMGVWHNAQFHIGAWLPQKLLPKPPPASTE